MELLDSPSEAAFRVEVRGWLADHVPAQPPPSRHTAGGVFGEMLMAAGEASPVSVLSPEGAEVLFLPLERIMEGCERHCEGHARLRMNLLRESAQKFWQMRHRCSRVCAPRMASASAAASLSDILST